MSVRDWLVAGLGQGVRRCTVGKLVDTENFVWVCIYPIANVPVCVPRIFRSQYPIVSTN